jgi:diguanylate cyclase (GGDEF)-like protein
LTGSGPIGPVRLRGSTPAGEDSELQLGGEPIRDEMNEVVGWNGTIADLSQEIAAKRLQRERDAAELASIAKSRFVSQVSHELQTPLTTVVGFSELLLMDGSLAPTQREQLLLIHKAGTWLQAMIADLLDLSRIETDNLRVTLGDVDIRPVIDEVLTLVQFQADAKDIRFVVEDSAMRLTVRADAVRLKQVLLNLATNAVKYSHPSGEVRISVTADSDRGRVCIAMRDNGLGMSAEQRDQLFQPFNRLGRENGQTPGSGIGLVLAKHLVEAMGGALGVDSALGQGSCFSVSLTLVQPDRAAARDRIERSMASARAGSGVGCAVLFINCDRFRQINDALGNAVGNDVLAMMDERLRGTLRRVAVASPAVPTDRGDALVARLSGDEFVVVLDNVRAPSDANVVAQRLLDVTAQPFITGGHQISCSISIGVVLGEQVQGDADAVLQHASMAMGEAKRAGGSRCLFFDPAMRERVVHRGELESDLRRALLEDQLFVEYQPVVELQRAAADAAKTGCAGVEALVRWQHPTRGAVPPTEFIGVAEECGLIGAVGQFVLSTACRQFVAWQRQLGVRAPRQLAVNLSRGQVGQAGFVDSVKAALRDSGMAPGQLQLEVTESLAVQDEALQEHLRDLRGIGVALALDDFGTGYSSLASLHMLPVDTIKIDRSFVSEVVESQHHRVLIEATIQVADSLQLGTVAEGIETAAQADALRQLGCRKGQGYYFSRPLSAADLLKWLQRDRSAT